jgi:hypothetical protein
MGVATAVTSILTLFVIGGDVMSEPSKNTSNTTDTRIKLVAKGVEATVAIRDSAASRDFLATLPLTMTLKDHAGTEKIASLPRKLSTTGAPAGMDPAVGDFTYYSPWGNLAIFYKDFSYSSGLVSLGRIESGLESLARLKQDVRITIEKVEDASAR